MRSSSTPKTRPEADLQAIDALFEQAGLQSNLRGKAGVPGDRSSSLGWKASGVTLRMRFERAARQELIPSAPLPRVAPNGVEWLPVAGWEKINWLWHGFSTRRGGLSRVYCADDAPGELNLGFTADDDRETVIRNRRLLAEAITGDPATPLVVLRQIHSNMVVLASATDASREDPRRSGARRQVFVAGVQS